MQFGGELTSPIPVNANPSVVRQALGALPTIGGANNLRVTSDNRAGGPWAVEFVGTLGGANQPLIEAPDAVLGWRDCRSLPLASVGGEGGGGPVADPSARRPLQWLGSCSALLLSQPVPLAVAGWEKGRGVRLDTGA